MSGCRRFRGGLIGPGIGLSLDGLRVLWLPHLDGGSRTGREVVEEQIPAPVLVLEGGADSSPEVLFGTLSTDRAEKLSLGLVCHVVVLRKGSEVFPQNPFRWLPVYTVSCIRQAPWGECVLMAG
jgi:hypothetical protein